MRGEKIKNDLRHDAGAFGRCTYCGRYSDNPNCLEFEYLCDCGKKRGYSGSFKKPTEESIWNESNKER
jgi:hypothetical protein